MCATDGGDMKVEVPKFPGTQNIMHEFQGQALIFSQFDFGWALIQLLPCFDSSPGVRTCLTSF